MKDEDAKDDIIWTPPQIDHQIYEDSGEVTQQRYPQRLRRPPDRLQYTQL